MSISVQRCQNLCLKCLLNVQHMRSCMLLKKVVCICTNKLLSCLFLQLFFSFIAVILMSKSVLLESSIKYDFFTVQKENRHDDCLSLYDSYFPYRFLMNSLKRYFKLTSLTYLLSISHLPFFISFELFSVYNIPIPNFD